MHVCVSVQNLHITLLDCKWVSILSKIRRDEGSTSAPQVSRATHPATGERDSCAQQPEADPPSRRSTAEGIFVVNEEKNCLGWMDGYMDFWLDGWIDVWVVDGRMDG